MKSSLTVALAFVLLLGNLASISSSVEDGDYDADDGDLSWSHSRDNKLIAYSNEDMNVYNGGFSQFSQDGDVASTTFRLNIAANNVQRLDLTNSGSLNVAWKGGETITTGYSRQSSLEWPSAFDFAIVRLDVVNLPQTGSPLIESKAFIVIPNIQGSEKFIDLTSPQFNSLGIDLVSMNLDDTSSYGDLFGFEGLDFGDLFDFEFNMADLGNIDQFGLPEYKDKVNRYYHDSKNGVSCYWGETRETELGF